MEVWEDITSYEKHYQVSNLGRVKSYCRVVRGKGGGETSIKGRVLKPTTYRNGYVGVSLSLGGLRRGYLIHRLVAEAFIANPFDKLEVNHINGDKACNHEVNLECSTRQENLSHAVRIGLTARGERNYFAKLSDSEAKELRNRYHLQNLTIRELAERFEVSRTTVSNIVQERFWKHV